MSAPVHIRMPLPSVISDANLPELGKRFAALMHEASGNPIRQQHAEDFVVVCAMRGWREVRATYTPETVQ